MTARRLRAAYGLTALAGAAFLVAFTYQRLSDECTVKVMVQEDGVGTKRVVSSVCD